MNSRSSAVSETRNMASKEESQDCGCFIEERESTHPCHQHATTHRDILPSIPQFYAHGSVFLTGVTGFVGKSILEKLLRSCDEVDKVFVLVREKKGVEPCERIKVLLQCSLFDRVKREKGEDIGAKKVVAIRGDMFEENLGISKEDETVLTQSNIRVVIHSAATVKFDEPLKVALSLNTLGTLRVIDLCCKLKNSSCSDLKALVHVSTAYSNCDMTTTIGETVLPSQFPPQMLIDALKWMPLEAFDKITPILLDKKPNTYTFTKQLAENVINTECTNRGIPYIIVRPAIVGASWKEPFPGWIDNMNGSSGLILACGMGLLRSMMAYPDAVANIVPVDIAANLIIAAPWYRSLNKHQRSAPSSEGGGDPDPKLAHHVYNSGAADCCEHNTHCQLQCKCKQQLTIQKEDLVINCEIGYLNNPLRWDSVPKFITKLYRENPLESCFR